MATQRGAADEQEGQIVVEHFKFWDVSPVDYKQGVKLMGQFDHGQAWGATLEQVLYICNPVNKRHGHTHVNVKDERNHLVAYLLRPDEDKKNIRVYIKNQFIPGDQDSWLIGQPSLLLLPAAKSIATEPPPSFDPTIDHFVCYRVLEAGPPQDGCTLEDQFDRHGGRVEEIERMVPAFFGVPVSKNGEVIRHPEEHLAIYEIQPTTEPQPQIRAIALDQFHSDAQHQLNLVALKSALLAVPTIKRDWSLA